VQRSDDPVTQATATGPLAGVRVLDFTRMIVGPVATMLLADLGADVIKIEPPEGEALRFMQDDDDPERSAFFIAANRNKRDLILDLGLEAAADVRDRLVAQADIVVHNFVPRLEERFGLSYARLRTIKPDLVYCGIGAWSGPKGAWFRRPGTDVLFQAASGLMSVTGEPDGNPTRAGAPIIDVTTGVTAAFAILAGLRHRDVTGEGVEVGTSLFEMALFAQSPPLAWADQREMDPPRLGNQSPMALIIELRCVGGHFVVSIPTEKMWRRLCGALKADDLANDPSYASATARLQRQPQIAEVLQAMAADRTAQELAGSLEAGGVPFAPVTGYREALRAVPEITGRELIHLERESYGSISVVPNPVRSSAWDTLVTRQSPTLGEHTVEIFDHLDNWGRPQPRTSSLLKEATHEPSTRADRG
jgi:crotonobetainyl-CoA:carnitine CoA-transferase CaiB-like acyl-CoA transferase